MKGESVNDKPLTLYQMFFELNEILCRRYPALTPFMVRKEKAGEVFLLINRINEEMNREKGINKGDKVVTMKNGDVHIRRQATNDNWY